MTVSRERVNVMCAHTHASRVQSLSTPPDPSMFTGMFVASSSSSSSTSERKEENRHGSLDLDEAYSFLLFDRMNSNASANEQRNVLSARSSCNRPISLLRACVCVYPRCLLNANHFCPYAYDQRPLAAGLPAYPLPLRPQHLLPRPRHWLH